MWTEFFDMSSGGSRKEPWETIVIEAPQTIAETVFYNRFGHNPHRITCTCCGEDYYVSESETLEEIMQDYEPGELFHGRRNVLIIKADEIKEEEKAGEVPTQGWVWQ